MSRSAGHYRHLNDHSFYFYEGEDLICQQDIGALVQDESQYEPKFLLLDHLGSTRAELVFDPVSLAPQIQEYYDLMPYGEVIDPPTTQESVLFTGKLRDKESNQDSFGPRNYSSTCFRFLSTDPIIMSPSTLRDPQQLNLYTYTRNNPIRFVDPTGEILTLSGDVDEVKRQLASILGTEDAMDRISYDSNSKTITVDLTGINLESNEGAKLLQEVVSAEDRYDLSVGDTVETLGGIVGVNPVKNLDRNPDSRYNYRNPPGKIPTDLPKFGIDAQVAYNPNYYNGFGISQRSLTTAQIPLEYTVYFHEPAEAYAKVQNTLQYAQAHARAHDRERRLREQRPLLRLHNFGSGGLADDPAKPANNTIIRR